VCKMVLGAGSAGRPMAVPTPAMAPSVVDRSSAEPAWVCVQISAGGKTTSLGDHDTEEEAARAFDRAAINKCGLENAKTNFDINDYLDEAEELLGASRAQPCHVVLASCC